MSEPETPDQVSEADAELEYDPAPGTVKDPYADPDFDGVQDPEAVDDDDSEVPIQALDTPSQDVKPEEIV